MIRFHKKTARPGLARVAPSSSRSGSAYFTRRRTVTQFVTALPPTLRVTPASGVVDRVAPI